MEDIHRHTLHHCCDYSLPTFNLYLISFELNINLMKFGITNFPVSDSVQYRNFKKKGPVWYSENLSKLFLLAIYIELLSFDIKL